ncbi:hypothetical protein RSOL_391640 [Rhizoctonia solani AG-3 Rhs1AP]|uniref:Uncharacterized protein n=1 Tax=Rhizoctonia solani AG-3 Rhs1AP TaxID=1086054 RepID=X8JEI1_9AGAM|nr:hypothetical protein RSOL_391640 [Rhizoctonia solani AG-3 Rhs1AP]
MPSFTLDGLAAVIEQRRAQREAQENGITSGSSEPDEFPEASQIARTEVSDDLIDPALRENREDEQPVTPAQQRRRPRSESTSIETPVQRSAKYARITELACNTYTLSGSKRKEVQDFSALDLHEKHIVSYALLQSLRHDLMVQEARHSSMSVNLSAQTADMLRVVLMAPTNRSYVRQELLDFIKSDLRTHWDDWGVSRSVVQNSDALAKLVASYSRRLTDDRFLIKSVLKKAIIEGHCINKVMNQITPGSMFVTDAHRGRWAWIIGYYKQHREDGSKENPRFWHDLDDSLLARNELLVSKEPDPREREEVRQIEYKDALLEYCHDHPTTEAARDSPYDMPNWQVTLEARLARKHSF